MIHCPRCGAPGIGQSRSCASCGFDLKGVRELVRRGGCDGFWPRTGIALALFFSIPLLYFRLGKYWDLTRYDFVAGFLFVLLLPGLPWAVSAIHCRISGQR